MRLLFILLSSLFTLPSFAQEPPIGSQALADSIEIRDQRATKKFQQAMDKWLITDFARVGLIANTLVKTSPFLQYPAMNPELGAYLATFEQETGTTIILRAYIDIPYFNPWVVAYRSSQKTRKTFEISKAKPAHAVIDIVYSPSGLKNKYEVAGYNITIRDSLRTPAFREIFSEADFTRMHDTLQAAMGKGPVQTIDSTGFNAAVIRALEALKGDTKMKPDPGYKVTFRKGNAEGYDTYKYPALNSHYQRDAAGNPIPWLALDAEKSYTLKGRYQVADPAAAKETPLNIEAADLIAGAPSIQDTLITQSLSPAGKARELAVEANYTRYNRFNKGVTTVAGQIALAAYEKLDMKLVVVYEQGNPLSFSLTDLKKYLDDVYGQAVVSWDVQAEAFEYSFSNEVAIGNSALSSYSSQMNTIIKAFKKSVPKIDDKTYYVFMVPSVSGADGYMPMKGQFGFVKATGNPAHTIAHELGHGAFRLWHTFSKENNIAAQGMTDNLMDYTKDKTRLYKHQWDLVHDPEVMLMPFLVDEGEEKIIQLSAIVKFNKINIPVSSGGASFFTPAGLPVHFDDMSKMDEMYFTIHKANDQDYKLSDGLTVVNRIVADRGVLIAFKYQGNFHTPIYKSTNALSGNITPSDNLFEGYQFEKGKFYIDNHTRNVSNSIIYWYDEQISGWKLVDFCLKNYANNISAFNPANEYKGAGFFATSIEMRARFGCNDYRSKLKILDNLDFFNDALYAKYNPWGNGGLLEKIKDRKGKIRTIYSTKNDRNEIEYFEYDYVLEDWISFDMLSAGIQSYLKIDFLADLAQKYGHTAFDILGMIPVVGEAFDAINGFWYLIEDDRGEAVLCFASMLPIVVDVFSKTTKFTIKYIRGVKLAKSYDLSLDAFATLGSISRILKKGNKIGCEECLNTFAKLLSECSDNAAEIEKLAKQITDQDKLKAVLNKIDQLGETKATFLEDIKFNSNGNWASAIGKNPEYIDAWQFLEKHPKIRTDYRSIEKVSSLLSDADFIKKLPKGKDDLAAIIDAVKNPLKIGTESKLVPLVEHLENIQIVVKRQSNALGFDKLITDLKNQSFAMQDGTTHMMNHLKTIPEGRIKSFNYVFEGADVSCKNCRFDIELFTGDPRFIEYKSWILENIQSISKQQLFEYFKQADNIEDIQYIFNKSKTPDLEKIKEQMKILFTNNKDEMFQTLNENLKSQLKISDYRDFVKSIGDTKSDLYKFIYVY